MAGHLVDEPLIGALLRMPVDAIRWRILQDLHTAGFTDVVPAHFAVWRYPGPQGRRPSELALEAGITKQAVNYLLGELETAGYLVRKPDPADGRSRQVELTERGRSLLRTLRRTVAAIEHEVARDLGAERLDELRSLLRALNATPLVSGFRESTGQPALLPMANETSESRRTPPR
jgi:DNA-binding MarR family transcriptional regulator